MEWTHQWESAMASRRGLGRAKHEQVQHLWVQSLVQEGSIASTKIPGEEKRSDMMTKHLAAAKQNEFLDKLEYVYLDGQSSLALKGT